MVSAGNSVVEQIANILKEQWSEIGADISILSLESGLAWERNRNKDFDMRMGGIGTADNVDPNANWLYGFISDGGAESGRTGWHDDEMNTLFRQSQVETDFEKRGEIYDQLQKIAMERGPSVPIFNASVVYAYRDNVQDFKILPTFNWRLWEVWLP
jgi:peptide/nickel transport system substrate-binding protein